MLGSIEKKGDWLGDYYGYDGGVSVPMVK